MALSAMVFVACVSMPWLLLGYQLLRHMNDTSANAAVGLTAVLAGALAGAALVAVGAACVVAADVRANFDDVFIEVTEDGPVLVGVRRNGRRVHADLD
jgi:hypothetical protein